jgi:hypothetical protein
MWPKCLNSVEENKISKGPLSLFWARSIQSIPFYPISLTWTAHQGTATQPKLLHSTVANNNSWILQLFSGCQFPSPKIQFNIFRPSTSSDGGACLNNLLKYKTLCTHNIQFLFCLMSERTIVILMCWRQWRLWRTTRNTWWYEIEVNKVYSNLFVCWWCNGFVYVTELANFGLLSVTE